VKCKLHYGESEEIHEKISCRTNFHGSTIQNPVNVERTGILTDRKPKYQGLTEETLNKIELSLNIHHVNLSSIFHMKEEYQIGL
jgi:hypothetical protein